MQGFSAIRRLGRDVKDLLYSGFRAYILGIAGYGTLYAYIPRIHLFLQISSVEREKP